MMIKDDENNKMNDETNKGLDEKLAELESIATEALLVELFNQKKAEVFENVVFQGQRRYYIENLKERDYSLENTTPYQLDIKGDVIEEGSWGNLLCKTVKLLLSKNPDYSDSILSFSCKWTKTAMFSREKKTNYKCISDDLYINCNHTALHSCWFLQDILSFFVVDINEVIFLIHRPCSAEPKKVQEYIEKRFKNRFIEFLISKHKKRRESAEKVVAIIDKHINPMLRSISKSYTNIFLFDDRATLSNYIKKIRQIIEFKYIYDDKAKTVLMKYLTYLVEYYKE